MPCLNVLVTDQAIAKLDAAVAALQRDIPAAHVSRSTVVRAALDQWIKARDETLSPPALPRTRTPATPATPSA